MPEAGVKVYRSEEWMGEWIMDKARSFIENCEEGAGNCRKETEVPNK